MGISPLSAQDHGHSHRDDRLIIIEVLAESTHKAVQSGIETTNQKGFMYPT